MNFWLQSRAVWDVDGWGVDNLKTSYKLRWIYVEWSLPENGGEEACLACLNLLWWIVWKRWWKPPDIVASLRASFQEGDLRNTKEEGDCPLGVLLQLRHSVLSNDGLLIFKSTKVIQPELKSFLLTSGVYRLEGRNVFVANITLTDIVDCHSDEFEDCCLLWCVLTGRWYECFTGM